MKTRSGNVMNRKLTADKSASGMDRINGSRAVTNMIKTIIILKAIIRYLNFNVNSPIMLVSIKTAAEMPVTGMIKESTFYVNEAKPCCNGGRDE